MSGPVQFSFANVEQAAPNAVLVGAESEEQAPLVQTLRLAPARKPPQADKPIDVLKLAKARLREVKRQLKQMAKLELEQAELERLIAAATLPKT